MLTRSRYRRIVRQAIISLCQWCGCTTYQRLYTTGPVCQSQQASSIPRPGSQRTSELFSPLHHYCNVSSHACRWFLVSVWMISVDASQCRGAVLHSPDRQATETQYQALLYSNVLIYVSTAINVFNSCLYMMISAQSQVSGCAFCFLNSFFRRTDANSLYHNFRTTFSYTFTWIMSQHLLIHLQDNVSIIPDSFLQTEHTCRVQVHSTLSWTPLQTPIWHHFDFTCQQLLRRWCCWSRHLWHRRLRHSWRTCQGRLWSRDHRHSKFRITTAWIEKVYSQREERRKQYGGKRRTKRWLRWVMKVQRDGKCLVLGRYCLHRSGNRPIKHCMRILS